MCHVHMTKMGLCSTSTQILAHASDELKQKYLPPLVSGEFTGTMCLTEPQCGSDLGQVTTKAEPQPDGTFRITGTKIFISCGDHDLTENVIHCVLARLPVNTQCAPSVMCDEAFVVTAHSGSPLVKASCRQSPC